ncbi:3-deoxy-manno-octulosonate cytidylyltransferase [Campylobacter sp. TTU_617]|uniref:3-deoxy-manno-octulosonate cytidylyltransferase n=1 Tax=Campylobacter sp. TTU_617 TaxID=2768148 RepID=UPI001904128F|nr:3-deoxy-manno-octulosonate cytidylyltransferase [Campylobacter sp. TTU_617]MBK1971822.1 3-deoxy-manno-octulosonate cytidylyltransferase [Campylobacter sp. TTU_617]
MIIIPARLKSTRFPKKILYKINNVPMFIATAQKMAKIDEVVIALDDEEVLKIAKDFGFKAVLTSKEHESGTDRIKEASDILNLNENEIIINVQADEPFIEEENIIKFKEFCSINLNEDVFMASCYKNISKIEANDPNLVKVVNDRFDFALYFSRAKIPFEREDYNDFKGHLGIYGYRVKSLREFCTFKTSDLEKSEKLEQLRALENGKKIKMLQINTKSIGIDTLEDYEKALKIFDHAN